VLVDDIHLRCEAGAAVFSPFLVSGKHLQNHILLMCGLS
jgi:hypothetical protein